MSGELASSRRRVLEAALAHVPAHGWSARTLRLALADCGLDRSAGLRLFPRGGDGLLDYFLADVDRRMAAALAGRDLGSMRLRDRIATAVRVRLELLAPHRRAVRRAVALESLPPRAGGAIAGLYRTVDAMWRAAGDEATDFSFYTKRALLAWIYSTTLIYWLDDESPGCEESWAFLERRIDEVMEVRKARGRLEDMLGRLAPRWRGRHATASQRRAP